MKTTKTLPSRETMIKAMSALQNEGWEKRMTVMSDESTRSDGYGILYAKGDERFWLNKDTIENLPV